MSEFSDPFVDTLSELRQTEKGNPDTLSAFNLIEEQVVSALDRAEPLARKTPGEALLDIQVSPTPSGKTELRLLSRFLPRGLAGILYWYVLYPFHEWVFYGMLAAIARVIGAPITRGPERFTPRITPACNLSPEYREPPLRPPK